MELFLRERLWDIIKEDLCAKHLCLQVFAEPKGGGKIQLPRGNPGETKRLGASSEEAEEEDLLPPTL